MPINEISSGISEIIPSIGNKLKDSLSFLSDIKDSGWEKVSTLVNDILGLSPLIEVTGFNMKEFNIEAGIPPGIMFSFVKEKDVEPEVINNMLEQNKDKEMLNFIVRGLQKADSLQKLIKIPGYKFSTLNMKIGLPPDVTLRFSRQ